MKPRARVSLSDRAYVVLSMRYQHGIANMNTNMRIAVRQIPKYHYSSLTKYLYPAPDESLSPGYIPRRISANRVHALLFHSYGNEQRECGGG